MNRIPAYVHTTFSCTSYACKIVFARFPNADVGPCRLGKLRGKPNYATKGSDGGARARTCIIHR